MFYAMISILMNRKYMKNNKKTQNKKYILLALVATATIFVLWFYSNNKNTTLPTDTQDTSGYSAATEQEKQEAEQHKKDLAQQSEQSKNPSAIKQVSLVITQFNNTEIRGYAQGIFEDGGTCTATASKGSQSITKSSVGFKNVSYTSCAPINWGTTLSTGTWNVTLNYKSAKAEGSKTQNLEVK